MEMLMNDKRRSGNSGSFADIGDLDKLESELNEIKGDEGSGSSSSGSKCCLGFQICLLDNNTKEVNTKSDSNVELRRPTSSAEVFDVDGIDVPEIPVTSNVSTNYSDREKA
jgi:hypothetical protein